MKYTAYIILLVLSSTSCSNEPKIRSLEDFYWLTGQWESINTESSQSGFEIWEQMEDKSLRGLGVWMNFGDTVEVEQLTITESSNRFFYIADVSSNPSPTLFEITSIGPEGFTCVNDSHDFPKMIVYRQLVDAMQVTIKGDNDSIVFHYAKVKKDK